jgi:hypothetical protein
MIELEEKLNVYRKTNRIQGKGQLSAMLVITRRAKENGLPLDSSLLVTRKKGQVTGLSQSAVQHILNDYGITRVLAKRVAALIAGTWIIC